MIKEKPTSLQLVEMLGDKFEITITSDVVNGLHYEYSQLKKKLDKVIELLIEYNMPCEMNDFMNKNVDYCSSNCSVDEEVYKKCWLRYIEQELENE